MNLSTLTIFGGFVTLLIAVVGSLISITRVLTKVQLGLDELKRMQEQQARQSERQFEQHGRQLEEIRVRIGAVENRLADWMEIVRTWRHDEDERLGGHKRRLEALEQKV